MNVTPTSRASAAPYIDEDSDEVRLARAEETLEHIDHVLEFRRVWRRRLKLMSLVVVPVFLTFVIRQTRHALA